MIKSMRDVEVYLREYYVLSGSPRIGTNYRLEDTFELAEHVGSPHERLRVIHVAGTSGKTSTAYYCAALLHEAGATVGLTVSPHISTVAERAQINGEPLDEDEYVGLFREYIAKVERLPGRQPSYFELMLVFALWVFDRRRVDYAVVETGMGGKYDSTNICRREDKLCIITDIGYDHVRILGEDLPSITAHKAGIIAEGNIVCTYEQDPEVMRVVRSIVYNNNADLQIASESNPTTYMQRNFELALFAHKKLAIRDGLRALTAREIYDVRNTSIPGRLEKIQRRSTTYLLDGAHNEQKMRTLFSTLDELNPGKKWPTILALKHDKDIKNVVPIIVAHATTILVSEYKKSQDMPISAVPAAQLAALFEGYSIDVQIEPDLVRAMQSIESEHGDILLTGSLYAVSEARAWLVENGGEVQ